MAKDYAVWRMDSVLEPWPIADGAAQAVVTSPPYWSRRSYGDDDAELGQGDDLDAYVDSLVSCFREAHRVLAGDGLLWVNLGDSSAKSGGAGGDYNKGGRKEGQRKYRQGRSGLPGPQYALVPFRFALAMQADGWLVRKSIVWDKSPTVRPEDPNHVRRPLEAHEHIFMLAPGRNRFDRAGLELAGELGDVWHFQPETRARQDSKGNRHPAPYPPELPLRCLRASGVKPGELVVDPFHGSGSSGDAARELGCGYVGMDLYVGRQRRRSRGSSRTTR
ncbi:MAG TPA: site-specific DNA-methyltransferase [Acidimicrobiales bacterium]|nr:site-specific DNA-methyltransferase [Acidimicrobiales bacterium]